MSPLAYRVGQCKICRGIYSWPIVSMTDWLAYDYPHCGVGTEYVEIQGSLDRQPICCDGDADSGVNE